MKFQGLPNHQIIPMGRIRVGSTLLFYGGNKLTELIGNKFYKHPYKPPAFHAAFYIGQGLFLNVGKFKVVQLLDKEFRSTRRIDVIDYQMSPEARARMARTAILDASKPKVGLSLPDYDIRGYLAFGLKFIKPSKKKDYCSDNVVDLHNTESHKVSDRKDETTAPWHLYEYALKTTDTSKMYTVWVGEDYKKKHG